MGAERPKARETTHQHLPLPRRVRNLHPAHCSEAQATRLENPRLGLFHPAPERPREFLSGGAASSVPLRNHWQLEPKRVSAPSWPARPGLPYLSQSLRLRLRLRIRDPPTLGRRRSSMFRGSREVPPLGGARGGAERREGASSGSVCRGRSSRRALVRERFRSRFQMRWGEGSGGH